MMRLLVLIVFLLGMSIPKGVHSTCYDRGVIALTFDDGMSIRSLQIAAVLEEKQIKATFFVIGNILVKNTNMLSLKQIYERGHQIANHSWSHSHITRLTNQQFDHEVLETQNGLSLIDPNLKLYIRPPYGGINQDVYDRLSKLGYSVVLWNIDLRDWSGRSEERMMDSYEKVMSKSDPSTDSFILILHEREHTLNILPKIIDISKSKGFRFVTIDNCLYF